MTDGFYREWNGFLDFAPNSVLNQNYVLLREDKDELIHLDAFPIEGWYWFNSKEEAVEQLGVNFRPAPLRSRQNAIINP